MDDEVGTFSRQKDPKATVAQEADSTYEVAVVDTQVQVRALSEMLSMSLFGVHSIAPTCIGKGYLWLSILVGNRIIHERMDISFKTNSGRVQLCGYVTIQQMRLW